jgi:hypothetical protein
MDKNPSRSEILLGSTNVAQIVEPSNDRTILVISDVEFYLIPVELLSTEQATLLYEADTWHPTSNPPREEALEMLEGPLSVYRIKPKNLRGTNICAVLNI